MADSIISESKWLAGLTPEMDIREAGQQILHTRISHVVRWLEKLEKQQDEESIHQLRVSTRRAEAAVRLLRPCLRRKVCRNARDTLRALRQSAGTARDTDVLISHVQKRLENASETSRPGLDFFLGFLFRQRSAAHHSLQSLAVGEFREQAERWHETRKGDHPQTFGPLAQEALRAAFSRFQNALDDNLESEAALHAVRIRGKRLRYVLEIVGPCLDRRLVEETYPQLEAMQEMLGEVNDAHTALTLITPLRSSLPSLGKPGGRYRTGLDTLLRAQQRRITQQRARFEIWQTHWRSMTHPSLDGP